MPAEQDGVDLLASVERQLSQIPERGATLSLTGLNGEPFIWYSRIIRLFLASGILIREGLPGEAIILIRSMIESGLRLEWLAYVDEVERPPLVLGAIGDGLTRFGYVVAEARRQQPDGPGLTEMEEQLAERRRLLAAARRKLAIQTHAPFDSEKVLFKALGRQDEYLDFLTSSQFVHGDHVTQRLATRQLPEETMGVFVRDHDPVRAIGLALTAAKWALRSQIAICSIAGWPPGDATALLKECEGFDERAMDGRAGP